MRATCQMEKLINPREKSKASFCWIQTMKTTTTMQKRKHLSSIANHVLHKCAEALDTTADRLIDEFEVGWKFETGDYSRKLIEFCSSKAMSVICCKLEDKIVDGSFSRFTFDIMLAWETPNTEDKNSSSYAEGVAKEKEDARAESIAQEEVSLFYSDLMPLLVNDEATVGEDAFVWFGSLVPLATDVVNARFTFETLTAATSNRLHFPGYDIYLKEIDKCIKYLEKQPTPTGVVLADDEYILHMEGTGKTHRVVRHIGGTSWPGRLTLTNYALYFEASGVINYEDALKIDLSKDIDHNVKRASTGPWGAPLFDKALVYESPQVSETVVLEFPEMTSSTRRELWLAMIKEVILLHQFLSKRKDITQLQGWEMQARTILAIVRLHAGREVKRILPPVPTSFLIFSLFDELPKGDLVVEELANTLKQVNTTHECSASSILKSLNISQPSTSFVEVEEEVTESPTVQPENLSSLETTITKSREEAKEVNVAMATAKELKEEGITDTFAVLGELLSPLSKLVPWSEEIVEWKRPLTSTTVLCLTLIVTYKEWIRHAMAVMMVWGAWKIYQARKQRLKDRLTEIVVYTGSDQSTIESIVTAQFGVQSLKAAVQTANISILKIYSIVLSKAPKHTDMVMIAMVGLAIFLALVPLKLIIMSLTVYVFGANAMEQRTESRSERRLKEWWNSIPVISVRTIDKTP